MNNNILSAEVGIRTYSQHTFFTEKVQKKFPDVISMLLYVNFFRRLFTRVFLEGRKCSFITV